MLPAWLRGEASRARLAAEGQALLPRRGQSPLRDQEYSTNWGSDQEEKIPRTSLSLLGDAGAIYLIHSMRFTESYSVTRTRLGGEQDITGPVDRTV